MKQSKQDKLNETTNFKCCGSFQNMIKLKTWIQGNVEHKEYHGFKAMLNRKNIFDSKKW